MKLVLAMLLLMPTRGLAWELLDPAQPSAGAVTITTVADLLMANRSTADAAGPLPRDFEDYTWIAFADGGVADICRRISPNPAAAALMTYQDRYVIFGAASLAVALFAHAHNMRVRVKLTSDGGRCRVEWFQTCSGPDSCPSVL